MIIDHRTYDFHPGKLKGWIDVYREYGLPVQQKHLGRLIGFFTTEIGPINQIVFMWAYENMGDREQRRAAMDQDPDWAAFRGKTAPLGALKQQTNKILAPTDFSPIQ
ncbi:MAG: NIPSNAP family protein [Alphaproteobacteria bacterium]|nr:NIPSNAP family protein [Alphaproteobacteria bacterium]MBL6954724.1 NIPSNAP family protein [Alphaproteobacteria bacterium]